MAASLSTRCSTIKNVKPEFIKWAAVIIKKLQLKINIFYFIFILSFIFLKYNKKYIKKKNSIKTHHEKCRSACWLCWFGARIYSLVIVTYMSYIICTIYSKEGKF